jgi:hypothetical protein
MHGQCKGSMLASSVVDHGFESSSDKTKDYKIGMCFFSANQDKVSEWNDKFTHGLLFKCASTIKIQLSGSVQYKGDTLNRTKDISILQR